MNKKICKKINILIFELILLIFIIYENTILTHYNNKNKEFEFSYNYSNKNETSSLFQKYNSKFKTYEFLMEHQHNLQINKQIIIRL
jgi:hypothetical protein